MGTNLSRRRFLQLASASVPASAVVTPLVSIAGESDPIHYTTWDRSEDDRGFTPDQHVVIRSAMNILHRRFRADYIKWCMWRLSKGVWVRDAYWEKTGLNWAEDEKSLLLGVQIGYLKEHFPKVIIKGFYEEGEVRGQARVGTVFVNPSSRTSINGNFEIELNRYHINKGANPNIWAGVIAHEMLHNLGHDHTNYTCYWQIIGFQQSIVTDGRAKADTPLAPFT